MRFAIGREWGIKELNEQKYFYFNATTKSIKKFQYEFLHARMSLVFGCSLFRLNIVKKRLHMRNLNVRESVVQLVDVHLRRTNITNILRTRGRNRLGRIGFGRNTYWVGLKVKPLEPLL